MNMALSGALDTLLPYEFKALLDAVRRDMRTEAERAMACDAYSSFHSYNAHCDKRLLEMLNPKRRTRESTANDRKEMECMHRCAACPSLSDCNKREKEAV